MKKVRFIVDYELDLDKFIKEFEERPRKRGWTWRDELQEIFEANLEGFAEDLFNEYGLEEFDWNIKMEVLEDEGKDTRTD